MNKELLHSLDNFYVQTDAEQVQTLRSVLIAANDNPENFIQAIRSNNFNQMDHLPLVYEALSNDLVNWSEFFLDELTMLLGKAKSIKNPNDILFLLDELAYIPAENFKYRKEYVEILTVELENNHPTFRYYAVSLLPDFILENDLVLIHKMRKLLQDPNWRVRYWTFIALQEVGALQEDEKLSFSDRLKAKLFDTMSFK